MCQINTDPMMAQTGILDVNVPPDIDSERTSPDIEAKIGMMKQYSDALKKEWLL